MASCSYARRVLSEAWKVATCKRVRGVWRVGEGKTGTWVVMRENVRIDCVPVLWSDRFPIAEEFRSNRLDSSSKLNFEGECDEQE